jgi:hypothetical protein
LRAAASSSDGTFARIDDEAGDEWSREKWVFTAEIRRREGAGFGKKPCDANLAKSTIAKKFVIPHYPFTANWESHRILHTMANKAKNAKGIRRARRPSQPQPSPDTTSPAATDRTRLIIAIAIMAIGFLALLPTIYAPTHGDVRLYEGVANDLLAGKLPYRDRVLEYPPYAVPIFLLPRVFGAQMYSAWFVILGLFADLLVKCLLFVTGKRQPNILQSLRRCCFIPPPSRSSNFSISSAMTSGLH